LHKSWIIFYNNESKFLKAKNTEFLFPVSINLQNCSTAELKWEKIPKKLSVYRRFLSYPGKNPF